MSEQLIEAMDSCLSDASLMCDQDYMRMVLRDAIKEMNSWEQREAALSVQNNKLREALAEILDCGSTGEDTQVMKDYAKEAIYNNPEQSLTAHNKRIRDDAIGEAAKFIDDDFGYVSTWGEAIRALKEKSK